MNCFFSSQNAPKYILQMGSVGTLWVAYTASPQYPKWIRKLKGGKRQYRSDGHGLQRNKPTTKFLLYQSGRDHVNTTLILYWVHLCISARPTSTKVHFHCINNNPASRVKPFKSIWPNFNRADTWPVSTAATARQNGAYNSSFCPTSLIRQAACCR